MTTQHHISIVNLLSEFIHSAVDKVAAIQAPSKKHNQEYEQLSKLPDYLLRDVGISRAQINQKLSKPFWWS